LIPADPYPWPYDGTLDPRRLALVITGEQPAWIGRSQGVARTAAVISTVAAAVRDAGGAVVHVRHGRSSRLRPGLPPAREDPSWAFTGRPCSGDLVVDATGVDGFYGSALDQELRDHGVDTLVLAGYGGEATVNSTLRSANDRGYECLTLIDGVAMFDARTGGPALCSITMSGGIFGAIAPSSALLAALSDLSLPTLLEALP
jgi:nicotinamidase-related amidase